MKPLRNYIAGFVFLLIFLPWTNLIASDPVRNAELLPQKGVPTVERTAVVMGTDISILIVTDQKTKANRAIEAALKEIRRIEDLMTDWREPSQVMDINNAAGIKPVAVDREVLFLLQEARKISEMTKGAFDITYAGAGNLWDFQESNPTIPEKKQIRKSVDLVDYKKLQINPRESTAFLEKKGMRIGLGGIAKGYAVDRATQKIREQGFENFAVNAGGDLTVRGKKANRLWWVSIRHPRDKKESLAILPLSNGSVVTSGDNERFFILNGNRYCHIIDPKTGYPVNHTQSVTIMAKRAYRADALSTGVFVLGAKKGMKVIESLDGVEGMIVDQNGKVHVSKGLQKGSGKADAGRL